MTLRAASAYACSVLSAFTFRKAVNFMLAETGFLLTRLTGKSVVLGMPWAASIEPVNFCNLRCPQCTTGTGTLTREKGSLAVSDFQTMLNRLSGHLVYLTLYFQGEPFLHPQFPAMVSMSRKQRIVTATSTNGNTIDSTVAEKIVESGLSRLIVSVDGTDQQTYEKYRAGGNLQQVLSGIKAVAEAKKQNRSALPLIEVQFLVMRHNEHQMKQIRDVAKNAGADLVTYKSVQIIDFTNADAILPESKRFNRYMKPAGGQWQLKKKPASRCRRIWNTTVVTLSGDVVPCCYDKNADHPMGNLLLQPFDAIWKGDAYRKFRKQVLENRSSIEMCCNCGE